MRRADPAAQCSLSRLEKVEACGGTTGIVSRAFEHSLFAWEAPLCTEDQRTGQESDVRCIYACVWQKVVCKLSILQAAMLTYACLTCT